MQNFPLAMVSVSPPNRPRPHSELLVASELEAGFQPSDQRVVGLHRFREFIRDQLRSRWIRQRFGGLERRQLPTKTTSTHSNENRRGSIRSRRRWKETRSRGSKTHRNLRRRRSRRSSTFDFSRVPSILNVFLSDVYTSVFFLFFLGSEFIATRQRSLFYALHTVRLGVSGWGGKGIDNQ